MTTRDADVAARASRTRLAVFDCDGVFTDGRLWLGDDGHEYKAFHTQDGHGVKRLLRAGVVVAVISGRRSDAVRRRMRELGIEHLVEACDDKLGALRAIQHEVGCGDDATACVGDDLPDLPLLEVAGLAIAVANAVDPILEVAHFRTRRPGGHGAVREVCDLLVSARNR